MVVHLGVIIVRNCQTLIEERSNRVRMNIWIAWNFLTDSELLLILEPCLFSSFPRNDCVVVALWIGHELFFGFGSSRTRHRVNCVTSIITVLVWQSDV